MKCVKGLEIVVLPANGRYYIGTLWTNEDGFVEPGCRISAYYRTKEMAKDALRSGFILRDTAENYFCAGDAGCLELKDLQLQK